MLTNLKTYFKKLNTDELYFDLIFAGLITIFQFTFVNIAGFATESLHPIFLIVFAFIIQFVLSYKLGSLIKRYREYSRKWVINLVGTFSFLFVFPMIFFVGVGVLMQTEYKTSQPWMMILILIIIITGVILGNNSISSKYESSEKSKKKNRIIISLTAISLAFLNFGFYSLMKSSDANSSIGNIIAFIGLMIVSGFLPFRMMMMFAPPKNKRNMIIGLIVIIYDFFLLFSQSIPNT
ncbi:MAG: hypothetical protein L3J35_12830 [Bacteroidales bacterium]|nr:hypothetical protein [Bacteroidales bacterium]